MPHPHLAARLQIFHILSMLSCCRHKVERFMQWVFAGSALTLFVPVLFHRANTEDAVDADPSLGEATLSHAPQLVQPFQQSQLCLSATRDATLQVLAHCFHSCLMIRKNSCIYTETISALHGMRVGQIIIAWQFPPPRQHERSSEQVWLFVQASQPRGKFSSRPSALLSSVWACSGRP